jgi:hypothetical protein
MSKRRSINEALVPAGLFGLPGGFDNTLSPASYTVQGKQPGYVYHMMTFNDTLQQPINKTNNEYYIHPGSTVRGRGYNHGDKTYTGVVNRIVKNEKGEVVCLYVQSFKTSKIVAVRVDDNLELLLPKNVDQYGGYHIAASDNLAIGNKQVGDD